MQIALFSRLIGLLVERGLADSSNDLSLPNRFPFVLIRMC